MPAKFVMPGDVEQVEASAMKKSQKTPLEPPPFSPPFTRSRGKVLNADNLDFIDPNQLLILTQQTRKRGAGSAPATLSRPPDEKRPRLDETPESPRTTAAKTKLSVTLKRVSPVTILAEGLSFPKNLARSSCSWNELKLT